MLKFEGKNTDIVVFIIQKLIKSPQIVVNIVFILKYFPFSKEYFNYVFVVVCKPDASYCGDAENGYPQSYCSLYKYAHFTIARIFFFCFLKTCSSVLLTS